MNYTKKQIADALDLAVLKPEATVNEIRRAARLVTRENIRNLCVAPCNVKLARLYTPRVCAVIGFPHGNTLPFVKLHEAAIAISCGATEIDVVVNYGRFLDGQRGVMVHELRTLVSMARKHGVKIKAILETCYYQPNQIQAACRICVFCGVDFVKTSTGFAAGGATPEAVRTILKAVKGKAQVKASGGIKTYADAARYLNLGCTRIGSSYYKELLP
jgi:deoxyribose-phosphate aldolase